MKQIATCPSCQSALHPTSGDCPKGCKPLTDAQRLRSQAKKQPAPIPQHICANCGSTRQPRTHTPGNFAIELLLWLFFILPGLIYSFWRVGNRQKICADCRSKDLIPTSSPRGRKLYQEFTQDPAQSRKTS